VGSIPTIVRTCKAAVTRPVGRLPGERHPIWQRNYYDHILRDDANAMNWDEDEENPRNKT
jgi:hypothetical protein